MSMQHPAFPRLLSALGVLLLACQAGGAGAQSASRDAAADSVRARQFIESRGYQPAGAPAQAGSYFAFLATKDGALTLVSVRDATTPQLLGEPMQLGEDPPQDVHWFDHTGDGVDGLVVTFNQQVENVIGTVIYALKRGRLEKMFADAEGTCRPAELRDLDRDTRLELVVFTEDPSDTNCGDQCHVVIWKNHQMAPGWVEVRRWTGSEWRDVSREFPSFYQQWVPRYERLATWLAEAPEADWCRQTTWLSNAEVVTKWAERARARAGGG